eukprot:6202260-Pleurochrysis_carterae.AAC.1
MPAFALLPGKAVRMTDRPRSRTDHPTKVQSSRRKSLDKNPLCLEPLHRKSLKTDVEKMPLDLHRAKSCQRYVCASDALCCHWPQLVARAH